MKRSLIITVIGFSLLTAALPSFAANDYVVLQGNANGTLASVERQAVADHLGQCPTCQAYYADLRALTPDLFVSMPGAAAWQPTPQGFAVLMDKVNAFEAIHSNAAKKTKKNTSISEWLQNRPNFAVVALGVETLVGYAWW